MVRRRVAGVLAFVTAGFMAVVACTGEDPDPPDVVFADGGSSGATSSGATSSGSPNDGGPILVETGADVDPRPYCVQAFAGGVPVGGRIVSCTSFEDGEDASVAGYTLAPAASGVGTVFRFDAGGATGRFAIRADSLAGDAGAVRGGSAMWRDGDGSTSVAVARRVAVHARIRTQFSPSDGDGIPAEGAVDILRIKSSNNGQVALRYARKTRARVSGSLTDVSGYFIEATSGDPGNDKAKVWGPSQQPFGPDQWEDIILEIQFSTGTGPEDEGTMQARVPDKKELLLQEQVFCPVGRIIEVTAGNVSSEAVGAPSPHLIDDVWIQIER